MNVFFSADCPYCGHRNKFTMEKNGQSDNRLHVYVCDVEEGGCDQPFVVGLKLEPVVTIKAIEGYRPVFHDEIADDDFYEEPYEGPVGLQHP